MRCVDAIRLAMSSSIMGEDRQGGSSGGAALGGKEGQRTASARSGWPIPRRKEYCWLLGGGLIYVSSFEAF